MRRNVAIAVFLAGILIIVGGVLIFRGLLATGALTMLIGAAFFGLSFIPKPEAGADAPPPMPPAERITNLFFEPARVFQNLRYHPRWLAAFLVIGLFSAAYQIAFIQRVGPETIAAADTERKIKSGFIKPEKADTIRAQEIEAAKSPLSRVIAPLNYIGVRIVLLLLILAGLYTLGVLAFGGRLNYWQSLSVVTHAALPVAVINSILSFILLYIKSVDDLEPLKGRRGLVRADLSILFSSEGQLYLYTIGSFFWHPDALRPVVDGDRLAPHERAAEHHQRMDTHTDTLGPGPRA